MQNVEHKTANLIENMKEKRKNSMINNPSGLKYSHCEHEQAMDGQSHLQNIVKLE